MLQFLDYTFFLNANGDITMDSELSPDALEVKAGDKFEVVITPNNGIIFKKLPN